MDPAHLQTWQREGMRQRKAPLIRLLGKRSPGGRPGYGAIYRRHQGRSEEAEDLGNRPCSLDPGTLSYLRSPGLLGFLNDCFLNGLSLTVWGCPSQRATPSPQFPSSHTIFPSRGELSKIPSWTGRLPQKHRGTSRPASSR